ncbi:MAG: fibro-slime domain-containing protein [Phycisphaerales bacterium]
MKRFLRTSVGAAGIIAAAGTVAVLPGGSVSGSPDPSDPYRNLPPTIQLTGVVRDFKELSAPGGHADFERNPTRGFAHYMMQVNDELDGDGKPVFRTSGRKVTSNWRDAAGRNIISPRSYIASRSGDVAGVMETVDGGSTTNSANFAKWFRDESGVNLSRPLAITLVRQTNSNIYTFNDRNDPLYQNRGGFFPINGELFGNSGGSTPSQNFHFTYELSTSFVYRQGSGQVFSFTGDDDVWVFIGGKLVIDIGGVHSAVSQTVELDRLTHLADGQRYDLKFFFAERHRTQSNFRIDTTINLESVQLPTTTALSD